MLGHRRRPGFNLIEVMIALSVAATVILAIGAFITSSFRSSGTEKDRAFASQHAMQMMQEIAAYRPVAPTDPTVPQLFNQPPGTYSYPLTTEPNAVAYQPLSGNPRINGKYKYVRHIKAAALASDKNSIEVTVEVYYADKNAATPAVDPKRPKPLAVVSNHLHVAPGGVGASQVLDVYALSIENMPHVYRKLDGQGYGDDYYIPSATEARLAFEQSLRNFSSLNPGITFRTHYITRLSVGREAQYKPYLNEGAGVATGTRDPMRWVYTYPGKLDSAADSSHYFDPATINGNITVGDVTGSPTVRMGGYALADEFNHCVQYPQEFNTGTAATGGTPIIPAGFPASAVVSPLSLRQFLEDLLQDTTGKYQNAIVVNLHGELFPGLPLRPWTDAAKDPEDKNLAPRTRRLVTHPYKLNNPVGDPTDPVRLMVYPYLDNGQDTPKSPTSKLQHVRLDPAAFPDYAQGAMIRVRGIKPYIDAAGIQPGTPGSLNDKLYAVTVQMVQREREDGPDWDQDTFPKVYPPPSPLPGDTGNTEAFYTSVVAWPQIPAVGSNVGFSTSLNEEEGLEDQPSGPDLPRNMHSGPHLASSHMLPSVVVPSSAPYPASPVPYPHWEGNDLVIELKDLDFDAHLLDDTRNNPRYSGIMTTQPFLLHGLQYFPDPYLANLDEPKASDFYQRNTARVLIDFPLMSSAAGQRFEVVTQLKKYNRTKTNALISSATPPAPPATNLGNFLDYVNNPTLLDDPTVSRTYFYAGATWNANQAMYMGTGASTYTPTIPWTDQVQTVGDPRFNPYYDLRFGDASMNYVSPNLNLYYSNFTQGNEVYKYIKNSLSTYSYGGRVINWQVDNVTSFESVPTTTSSVTVKTKRRGGRGRRGRATTVITVTDNDIGFRQSHTDWNNTKFNGPAYFRLWREAMLRNGLVMVNVAGQPFGYIGLGGDFSLKGTINGSGAIQMSPQLYTNSTSPQAGRNEMDDENPFIYREDNRHDPAWPSDWSGLGNAWVANPDVGDLYPSYAYGTRNDYMSSFLPFGNLPAGGGVGTTDIFRRENASGINSGDWDAIADRSTGRNSKLTDPDGGLTSFLNNPSDVSRTTSGDSTSVTTLGAAVAASFKTQVQALRSWYPFEIGTGTGSTEYNDGWAAGLRDASPSYLNATGALLGHAKGGTWQAARGLVIKDNSSKAPFSGTRRAFMFLNTSRPEAYDKVAGVLDNAVLGMVQTYFDASAVALGSDNLKALPRVTVTTPALGDVLRIATGSVGVTWDQEWLRPDGKQFQTTTAYPASAPSTASGGPLPLTYFLKYRDLTVGGPWQMAKVTGGATVNEPITNLVPGPYDPGQIPKPPFDSGFMPTPNVAGYDRAANVTSGTLTWNYSALPAGDYLLRVEAYRKDTTLPAPSLLGSNYAFHEIRVTIAP